MRCWWANLKNTMTVLRASDIALAERVTVLEREPAHQKCDICKEWGHEPDMESLPLSIYEQLFKKRRESNDIDDYNVFTRRSEDPHYYFHPACLKKSGYRKVEANVGGWVKKGKSNGKV